MANGSRPFGAAGGVRAAYLAVPPSGARDGEAVGPPCARTLFLPSQGPHPLGPRASMARGEG